MLKRLGDSDWVYVTVLDSGVVICACVEIFRRLLAGLIDELSGLYIVQVLSAMDSTASAYFTL
jgi:hypothetical protein